MVKTRRQSLEESTSRDGGTLGILVRSTFRESIRFKLPHYEYLILSYLHLTGRYNEQQEQ